MSGRDVEDLREALRRAVALVQEAVDVVALREEQIAALADLFNRTLLEWERADAKSARARAGRAKGAASAREKGADKKRDEARKRAEVVLRMKRMRGSSGRAIARHLGLSRKTVSKILAPSGS